MPPFQRSCRLFLAYGFERSRTFRCNVLHRLFGFFCVFAPQHQKFADFLNGDACEFAANLSEHGGALFAVDIVEPDLDKFVSLEAAIDFGKHGGREAFLADGSDRLQVMRGRPQFAASSGGQFIHDRILTCFSGQRQRDTLNLKEKGEGKPKRHKTNKAWMTEHVNDSFVQRAKAAGLRSRAAFKLSEIDDKDHLLKPGMTVVDLGSAPGSWSQVAVRRISPGGRLFALDLLPMDPLHGVDFLQGDFQDDAVLADFESRLEGRPVDLVLSDMAPNMSGIPLADQARVMLLAELTLEFCGRHLKPGGSLLVKVFQGSGFMELRSAMTQMFATLQVRKPAASRGRSAEIFLLARKKRS